MSIPDEMTAAEYLAYIEGGGDSPRQGRIRNARRTTIEWHGESITFDSAAEANRFIELKLDEAQGGISDLRRQPRFVLQPPFVHKGKRIRAIHYTADFAYTENGVKVIEEVKGFHTEIYKRNRKEFLYQYGSDYEFRELQV